MTPTDPERLAALNKIIEMIIKKFDYSVSSVGFIEPDANPVMHRYWAEVIKNLDGEEAVRQRLAQSAIETFIHGILYWLDSSDDIRLQAKSPNGKWYSINELTEGEAFGDFMVGLGTDQSMGVLR